MSRIPPKPEVREGKVHRRIVGAAPELGRVGRMASEPRRKRKSKSGRNKGPSRRRRRSSRVLTNWLVLLLSIAGLTFGCVILWSIFNQKELAPLAPLPAENVPPLPSDRALSMVEQMLAATNPEDLESLIRPGSLSADQAIDILRRIREEQTQAARPIWVGTIDSLSVPIEFISVNYKDSYPRPALFTLDSEGEWKLDFDAFAIHCIPEFTSLLEDGKQGGLVRVQVEEDSYYNNWFGDDSEWNCYLLTHPGRKTSLYGYCKRGSRVDTAMEVINQRTLRHTETKSTKELPAPLRKKQRARVTLMIERPAGARNRQFEITQVISDDWVVSEKPFDEDFPN